MAQLATNYGIAPNTAKGALDLIKAEGLAEAWQGYGTFVAAA